jgi:RNA polymerase sigma-70 factor (ECF subfamily)
VKSESREAPLPASYSPELIELCRRGDRAALQQVLRNEGPYVQRVLTRIVGTKESVEDLLQLTFEHALRAFPSFRGEASVRTWLTRIAVRTAMHELKHPARKRRAALEVIEGGLSAASPSQPQREAEMRSRLASLYEHLAKLEPAQRTAFVLFQVEGRSMEEVAALMDSNLSTTKSRVMWARRKLFDRLRKDPRTEDWLSEYGGGS